ncbi:protein-tyrosine-phosphatase [Mycobacterium sp. DL592]|uniref:arsenate reductase/protein-tyrosine-phosphatase family protein n=1 Tax=Mycobacterium sp. DL592 TaxID=2675524 RepID=UPI00352D2A03
MAERYTAAYARQHQLSHLLASSAGTHAVVAHPMHHEAAAVLAEIGGDASEFAARQLNSRIASDADLILTMTMAQRDMVLELAPRQLRRTFSLGEASRLASEGGGISVTDLADLRPRLQSSELVDVPDPIGQSPEFFAMVGFQIAALLTPILELCRQ